MTTRLDNYPLTSREMDVIRQLSRGKSNKEIADELNMSEQTCKNHVAAIAWKLQTSGRTAAVIKAVKQGLIEL